MPNPELRVEIGAVITDLERNLAKATKHLQKFSDKTAALGKRIQGVGMKMSLTLSAPLAILGGLAVKTAADFETLGVSLNTTFKGNEKAAKAAFDQIIKFASKTPFQIEQVASAFIKLKNFGLDPSERALTSYGDTAAAMGKSLDQMVEAVADAATGEFERLKEFGIKASSQGDKVSFTFRGVTTTVQKEAAAIEGFLIGLGETEFAGGMEAQSKTFTGQLSTMRDGVALLAKSFGDILIPMLNPIIKKIGELAKKFQELSPETKKVIVVVGLLVAALGPLLTIIGVMMTTAIPGLITVFGALSSAVLWTTGSFLKLTGAMLANPIGAIVAAVALLVLAFTQMVQKITPAVSKLKTFFNLIRSGGDHVKFMTLQLKDQFDAMNAEAEATKKANKELAELKWNEKVAAENAKELTAELLAQAKAAEKAAKAALALKNARFAVTAVKGEQIGVTDTTGGDREEDPIVQIDDISKRVTDAQAATILALHDFNMAASDIIQGGIADTFARIGEVIGNALVNGGNVMQALGGALLAGIGDIAVRLGKAAIEIGVAMLAIKASFKNPFTAIAAGIALIALGTALGGIANNAINGGSGGAIGDTGNTGGSGSRRGTRSSINNVTPGSGEDTVVFELQGTKLIGLLQNTVKRNRSFGGSIDLLTG